MSTGWQAGSGRYDDMTYNRCGRSGLDLPALSLGLWHNFGGVADFDTATAMVQRAFDLGITHFDLANNYGPPPGSAEDTFGSRKYLIASLDQSLQRMGLDYVDIYYHHRPDPETPLEETMGALDHIVRQGKALYVGISSYDPERTRAAAAILRNLGTPCLIHQPSYSMLNRRVEDGLLDSLAELGIGCIAFCPLSQGLLTSRYLDGIPQDSRAASAHGSLQEAAVTQEKVAQLRQLHDVAQERGQTLAQMALAWVLRWEEVTTALIGASRPEQIEENVGALSAPDFTDEELQRIDDILADA